MCINTPTERCSNSQQQDCKHSGQKQRNAKGKCQKQLDNQLVAGVIHNNYFNDFKKSKKIYRSSHQEVLCNKCVLRNFAKFTRKHLCQSLFLNKVSVLRHATLLKKGVWRKCFLVNFAKFLRTPHLTEHLRWLLLDNVVGIFLSKVLGAV